MFDVEKDELFFCDEKFPIILHMGKTVDGIYSRFHEEIEIKLVKSGRLTARVDAKPITAEEGEIIFINPYEIHSNLYVNGEEGVYDLLILDIDFFEKAGISAIDLRKIFSEKKMRFNNLIKNQEASDVLHRLAESSAFETDCEKLYASALLLEFFALLIQSETSTVDGINQYESVSFFRSIEPAVMKIRDEYFNKLSGEDLAKMCGMSRYHFCRVFKRVMGATPVQYQTQYRLHIADVLLQNHDLSISEVAAQVGFEDEAYFSRCYKKFRGISPKKGRNKDSK